MPVDIACQAQSAGPNWSWRLVDGKRCWYQGRRRISKDRLFWKVAPKAPPRLDIPIPYPRPTYGDPALTSIWPPLPKLPDEPPAVLAYQPIPVRTILYRIPEDPLPLEPEPPPKPEPDIVPTPAGSSLWYIIFSVSSVLTLVSAIEWLAKRPRLIDERDEVI